MPKSPTPASAQTAGQNPPAAAGDPSPAPVSGPGTAADRAAGGPAAGTEPARCRTCGSAVVEAVNGGAFGAGECRACEHRRYRSQPALLAACRGVVGLVYRDDDGHERIDFGQYERAERACASAVSLAGHGGAA